MIVKGYLIVRADGTFRVAKQPRLPLEPNEFGFRLSVTLPDAWGKVIGDIDVTVPDTVIPEIEIGFTDEIERRAHRHDHGYEPSTTT